MFNSCVFSDYWKHLVLMDFDKNRSITNWLNPQKITIPCGTVFIVLQISKHWKNIAQCSITIEKVSNRIDIAVKNYIMKHNFYAKCDIFWNSWEITNFEKTGFCICKIFYQNTAPKTPCRPAPTWHCAWYICGFIFKVINNDLNHYRYYHSSPSSSKCVFVWHDKCILTFYWFNLQLSINIDLRFDIKMIIG